MASNYTANYQLNQWEGSDKVLREEFNADNAKLDAALAELAETAAGKAGQADTQAALSALQTQIDAKAAQTDLNTVSASICMLKLAETVTTANTAQVNLSLSGHDMSRFRALKIIVSATTSSDGLQMRFNGVSTESYYTTSTTSTTNPYRYSYIYVSSRSTGGVSATIELIPHKEGTYTAALIHAADLSTTLTNWSYAAVCNAVPFQSLTSINFITETASATIQTGACFTVYGLLK